MFLVCSFGRTKSIMWVQSLFFSFLQCVFITHPVAILLYSLYTAYKYQGDMSIFDHHDDGIIAQPGELSPRRRPSSPGRSDQETKLNEVSFHGNTIFNSHANKHAIFCRGVGVIDARRCPGLPTRLVTLKYQKH